MNRYSIFFLAIFFSFLNFFFIYYGWNQPDSREEVKHCATILKGRDLSIYQEESVRTLQTKLNGMKKTMEGIQYERDILRVEVKTKEKEITRLKKKLDFSKNSLKERKFQEDGMSFDDRVDFFLPEKELITLEDIERIEPFILNFSIPKPLIVSVDGNWIPLSWRGPHSKMCPNCQLVLNKNEDANIIITSNRVCSYKQIKSRKNQLVACGCGEAWPHTNPNAPPFDFWKEAQLRCDVSTSFRPKDQFWTTWSDIYHAPPQWNINNMTALVKQLLKPPSIKSPTNLTNAIQNHGVMLFLHGNCGGPSGRGDLIKKMIQLDNFRIIDSPGDCFHNKDLIEVKEQDWYWGDSEAHRNSFKTELASWYKVTSSLENSFTADYFTEKRFQALLAGSIPLVFKNDNSRTYLPSPNAAIFVEDFEADPGKLLAHLQSLQQNEDLYLQYFEWKKRGITRQFANILFHGFTYLPCRICEYYSREFKEFE